MVSTKFTTIIQKNLKDIHPHRILAIKSWKKRVNKVKIQCETSQITNYLKRYLLKNISKIPESNIIIIHSYKFFKKPRTIIYLKVHFLEKQYLVGIQHLELVVN